MVRIYLSEAEGRLHDILEYVHDEADVSGWTVYCGIAGYGQSGKVRTSSLAVLSLDLPITVEFFERPDKASAIIEHLSTEVPAGHIVQWPASVLGE